MLKAGYYKPQVKVWFIVIHPKIKSVSLSSLSRKYFKTGIETQLNIFHHYKNLQGL
jgi:hypothetical protein